MPRRLQATFTAVAGLGWVALILWVPAIVSIGLAVAAAVSWCLWLERHPTA